MRDHCSKEGEDPRGSSQHLFPIIRSGTGFLQNEFILWTPQTTETAKQLQGTQYSSPAQWIGQCHRHYLPSKGCSVTQPRLHPLSVQFVMNKQHFVAWWKQFLDLVMSFKENTLSKSRALCICSTNCSMQRNSVAYQWSPILETKAQDCSGELNAADKYSRKSTAKTKGFGKGGKRMITLSNKNTWNPVCHLTLLLENSICCE